MKIVKTFLSILSVSLLLLSCGKDDGGTSINKGGDSTGTSTGKKEPNILPTTIKVGTYNVWVTNNGNKYTGYEWTVRKDRLAQSVVNNAFDIFGIQECDNTIKSSLPAAVAAKAGDKGIKYEWHINKDSNIGFAYNKERLEVTTPKVFWLSDTPDKKSNCWDGYSGRLCLYTVVTDKLTDVKFGFMVTHGPLNDDQYRVNMAKLLNERAETYSNGEIPVILVGDMNTVATEPGYTELRKYWKDCYGEAPYDFVYGPIGSFNGHKTSNSLDDVTKRIDYVFLRDPKKQVEVATFKVDNSVFDNFYPSDHCPVSAQMNMKK